MKINKTTTYVLTAFLLVLLMCQSAFARRPKPEVIRMYGDSQSLAAVIFPLKDRFEKETGVRIVSITETSAVAALQELDAGDCDGVIAAMSFEELNQQADTAGIQRRNKALTQHIVLYSDVNYRVIVHPQNPVAALSDNQLRKIFSGSYENWGDVDGPDRPLTIVWGDKSTGAAWVIADRIMEGEPVQGKSTVASDTSAIVAKVASTPDSVAIVPQSAVNSSVKTVQTSELKIKGPIILASVSFPHKPLFKLIKFLKENGVANIGF